MPGRLQTFTAIGEVRAAIGAGPSPLPVQELNELDRIERIRRHNGLDTRYVTVGRPGALDGFLPVYPTPRDADPSGSVRRLVTAADHVDWTTAALLGSDGTVPNSLVAAADTAADLISAAATAGTGCDLWCLPHADDPQRAAVADALPAIRWSQQRQEAYFDLPFASFDAYLAGLSTSRRSQMRRERRRFLDSSVTLRVLPALDAVELASLLTQVERRHGLDASDEWEELYLATTGLAMGSAGTALVAVDNGRAVAFTILWRVGSYWRVRCWGCDYARPVVRAAALYPNLMFYEPIMRASSGGARRLMVGTGSLESKVIRGARLRTLHTLAWT